MASQDNSTSQPTSQNLTQPATPVRLHNREFKAWLVEKYNKCNVEFPFLKSIHPNYKDPAEIDSQIVNLSDLDDPPADFQIAYLINRNPAMPAAIALVAHHFWNINAEKALKNSEDRIAAFRKLAFNQDERFRIRNVHELSQLSRDAGPRLLKPEILRRLGKLPISRHYPDFSEGTDWEEQRTRPVFPPENDGENVGDSDGGSSGNLTLEELPPNLKIVRECLERLLVQLRYQGLAVASKGIDATGFHALDDTSEGSRRRRLPLRKIPLALDIKHNVDHNNFNPSRMLYDSRERGPVHNSNEVIAKSKYDCIAMAAKFLDVGITEIDIENLQESGIQETQSHRLFVHLSFHRFFDSLGAQSFKDLLHKSTFLRGQFSHTASPVVRCASNHETTLVRATNSLVWLESSTIDDGPAGATMQKILQTLFLQSVNPPAPAGQRQGDHCAVDNCKSKLVGTGICQSMPLRIAVSLPPRISPTDHTSNNIRINYHDEKEGKEDVAVYRWLGGIYANSDNEYSETTRYRVYWTDSLRGEKPRGTISMYDPFQADGQVIEGVPPSHQNEPIPGEWWKDTFKPVIFYERIFNPDLNDITLAAAVLGDIKTASDEGRYILQLPSCDWAFPSSSTDDSDNQGDSAPSNSNLPSTSNNGTSGLPQFQGAEAFAGASFDALLNSSDNSGDTQMQDVVDYGDNDYIQVTGNTGAAENEYTVNQHGGPVQSMIPVSPRNDVGFVAYDSSMQQSAPDQPRRILEQQYTNPSATSNHIMGRNPLNSRNIDISSQGPHQYILDQINNGHVQNFHSQNLQATSPMGLLQPHDMHNFHSTNPSFGNGISSNTAEGMEFLQGSPPTPDIFSDVHQQNGSYGEDNDSNYGLDGLRYGFY
ncbi:conserved hypothetical protein [Talaromyces stipitatus ATCC 10500]|uniref:Uncharacterized protein n=1 Tax=Talaromyces stipitatus (strain ATCC 10500 / CBS 375.48 / QM 6759 / NRRL 1006) TaxID=441959 RepID=B8M163_TALSN|nr:uncharacterized protein TSTA_082380 [Talaromyces stipitatus ATCC 10500]EED21005.1 conserved hypothetical protein [Talaromyces stipitatus ATCC 10500]